MAELFQPLRIIAQPKASYLEKYIHGIDRSCNRSQRFIRAETNPHHLNYPTIEIPKHLNSQRLYIRVTLVTLCSEQVPVTCIHPDPIDTSELNVIKDVAKNTLYFPISEEDLNNERKSFQIIRRKLTKRELRNYGQLSLLDTNELAVPSTDNLHDVRRIIDVYQSGKSQLLFSIAELFDDDLLPVIYDVTSVYSHIMTAITARPINKYKSFVIWAPKKGCWCGGDDILMVVPKLDKTKVCQVYFECLSSNEKSQIHFEFADMKTIAFTTPPCPIKATRNQSIEIPIVVTQNGQEIARVYFMYHSCDKRSNFDIDSMFDSSNSLNTNEQSSHLDMYLDDTDVLSDHNVKIDK